MKILVFTLTGLLLGVGPLMSVSLDKGKPVQVRFAGWKTNFDKRSIDLDEIRSGGPPKDGIPALDHPKFVSPEQARSWLKPNEPVIALKVNNEARGYPLQILIWHEIVNDSLGGVPVTVSFCPLCHSAIVFDRRLDNRVYNFGVSGLLRHSDMIMYDRQTESWWQQAIGTAIVGDLVGKRLDQLPSQIVSFREFTSAYPRGNILSRKTGYRRRYGQNPYVGYDDIHSTPFLFDGPKDGRLPPMERIVVVTLGGKSKAYPYSLTAKRHVIHDSIGSEDIVIFHAPGTVSALDRARIATSRDIGATGVFRSRLDGRMLTFHYKDGAFRDRESNSKWNLLGQCVDGTLSGKHLDPIVHGDFFAFAWLAFAAETEVYKGS